MGSIRLACAGAQAIARELEGVHFTVAFECDPFVTKTLGELFYQVHRSMLPAGAADSYGYIAAVVAGQGVQPDLQKVGNVVLHQRNRFLGA